MATAGQVDDSNHLYSLQPTYFLGPDVATTDEGHMNQLPQTSSSSGLSYEAYDFMMPGATLQPDIDMGSVDWVWSLPQMVPSIPMQPNDDVDLTDAAQGLITNTSNFQSWNPAASPADNTNQNVHDSTEHGASSSEDEHDDEIIEQLSTRLGALLIGDMGELRYYGPTSNLTLTEGGIPREHRPSVTRRSKEAIAELEQNGIGHDPDIDLVDQLIDLYFTWQDPSCHIVDKLIFHEERDLCKGSDRESSLYSAALENVICALGALFHGDKHPDLPRPLSKFFARRAKILVEYELDCPKIATVQTFSLLSWHEATCTQDSRGWLYAGAATRISLDLGLHIDTTARVEDGSMTVRASYARSVAFWGSFLTDRMWGFYLGRPFSLHIPEISLPLPSPKEPEDTQHVWTPSGMFDGEDDVEKPPILDCSRDMLALQWVTLCQIVSSLTVTLYGRRVVSKEDLVDLGVETFRRLREWKSDLPSQLQYDPRDKSARVTPHVLLLQYD
ncbi:hypothetical protein W97_07761 [Coniosporium apollinis CBS 100218]|uniref:Xylanolytic transcriptional activator regulatory domain-containing protein n=1 Tax=Coniosporium apollinis (strain CBS 100218) TaxID=1168221 RepID=R7Z2P6_CONA1|nr:uncharacterized protein W97_07761 [Coniosporium apollinis CBS 100218]EON68437.1 hypothetical protein W97_07761 [Coniosporium apollinis CBS 100218]